MEVNQETRAKIMAAANQLYERAERAGFPRVDEVRSLAKVDMNAASTVMKEWRRMQTAIPATVVAAVPDRLRLAHETALTTLWGEAQEIANEALKAAQASWDIERAEADSLRDEVSSAYEAQAVELREALAKTQEQAEMLEDAAKKSADDAELLATVTKERDEALTRAAIAEQKSQDLEARVTDLKGECDRAYADSARLRIERDEAVNQVEHIRQESTHQVQAAQARADQAKEEVAGASAKLDALRDELANAKAKLSADAAGHAEQQRLATLEAQRLTDLVATANTARDQAVSAASLAKEEAANLRGRTESLQAQLASLMTLLGDRKPESPSPAPADQNQKTTGKGGKKGG
ncbi:DNA-binding protein [Aquabacterium sp. CECT 9606]|uniref:DNA-binding protein n=1 Tax=Aquabacterium sp. CECT 9606 TaxID=2845822 RepID=UPI001E4C48D4|nr:DNA-binding protein [Aquabacterium sp. CECT 9606]CAH0356014.1 hypothetical protein AQB9606_04502 [Aquabacterium sp. CECT 9606]